MTDKELKKLSRTDLVEMLLEVTRENEQLRWELTETREKLESKMIAIENAGSLAEAALQLNGVFEAAQSACAQYAQNLQQRGEMGGSNFAEQETEVLQTEPDCGTQDAEPESPTHCIGMEQDAQMQCDRMIRDTQEQCDHMIEDTQAQCDCMTQDTQERCDGMLQEMQEQCSRMEQDAQAKCDRMLRRAKQDADEYWEYVRKNARALHLEQHKSGQQDQNNL